MHLGTVVATVLQLLGAQPAQGERWREVATHLHLIDERLLLTMANLQTDVVMARVFLGDDVQALLDEHFSDLGNRRAHHVIHEPIDLIP
ncbi:hypothetical protein D3C72_1790720 [compost metagenome]